MDDRFKLLSDYSEKEFVCICYTKSIEALRNHLYVTRFSCCVAETITGFFGPFD